MCPHVALSSSGSMHSSFLFIFVACIYCMFCFSISALDSIVADPHIQIRVSQYGRWIKNVKKNSLSRRFDVQTSWGNDQKAKTELNALFFSPSLCLVL